MVTLILYGRRDCHLCDTAKQALAELQRRVDFEVEERDVDDDPEWVGEYGDQVPVGLVAGRKVFKYRVDPVRVLRSLEKAALLARKRTPW